MIPIEYFIRTIFLQNTEKREYFVKNFSMKTLHLFHVINQTEREQNEDKKESELRQN